MIAVDTNILVYSHREESPWFESAFHQIRALAEGKLPWAIPWPCVHEFLATVTHPRIYKPSTPLEHALEQIECWMESPSLSLLGESEDYWPHLRRTTIRGKNTGGSIHDARVVALCLEHGIQTLWTADRDFSRYPELNCKNPLT